MILCVKVLLIFDFLLISFSFASSGSYCESDIQCPSGQCCAIVYTNERDPDDHVGFTLEAYYMGWKDEDHHTCKEKGGLWDRCKDSGNCKPDYECGIIPSDWEFPRCHIRTRDCYRDYGFDINDYQKSDYYCLAGRHCAHTYTFYPRTDTVSPHYGKYLSMEALLLGWRAGDHLKCQENREVREICFSSEQCKSNVCGASEKTKQRGGFSTCHERTSDCYKDGDFNVKDHQRSDFYCLGDQHCAHVFHFFPRGSLTSTYDAWYDTHFLTSEAERMGWGYEDQHTCKENREIGDACYLDEQCKSNICHSVFLGYFERDVHELFMITNDKKECGECYNDIPCDDELEFCLSSEGDFNKLDFTYVDFYTCVQKGDMWDRCVVDSHCLTGIGLFCRNGKCVECEEDDECEDGKYCVEGKCSSCSEDGDCDSDTEFCYINPVEYYERRFGWTPEDDKFECIGKLGVGNVCSRDGNCFGVCISARCKECRSDSQCGSSGFCYTQWRDYYQRVYGWNDVYTCKNKLGEGSVCGGDNYCGSSVCTSGRCRGCRKGSCETGNFCLQKPVHESIRSYFSRVFHWDDYLQCKGKLGIGSVCEIDDHCRSGNCQSARCRER